MKVEIFVRHCIASEISAHKKRFPGFSRELCHRNFLETLDERRANVTYLLDTAKGKREDHFLEGAVVEIREGSEAGSFLRLLDYVEGKKFAPETILYFVEDDYLHRPRWLDVLCEAFTVPGVDYATLYDHKDKYFSPTYADLTAKLFITPSCHWRTIPSTTHTFAVKYKTLMCDLAVHRRYSEGRKISADHEKFCHLGAQGKRLISPIPGWATHVEPEFASPCLDWESYFLKENLCLQNS